MRLATRDLYESAYFHSCGLNLKEIWLNEKGDATFLFDDLEDEDKQLDILQESYQRGGAEVNVKLFCKSLKRVKDRMFREKRKTGAE